jgi:hypothetical protein
VVSTTPRPLYPPGKTRHPLYRRLGGPQGRSGRVRKISPPPGFDPRTVQPVASRHNPQQISKIPYYDYGRQTAPKVSADHLAFSNTLHKHKKEGMEMASLHVVPRNTTDSDRINNTAEMRMVTDPATMIHSAFKIVIATEEVIWCRITRYCTTRHQHNFHRHHCTKKKSTQKCLTISSKL